MRPTNAGADRGPRALSRCFTSLRPAWVRFVGGAALAAGAVATAVAAHAAPASTEVERLILDVASKDAAVQEAAAVALGKTGDPKLLPLLEALREGSVYVRTRADGTKQTVIAGEKVTEGERTLVPIFSAYGREPVRGTDGKPATADLASLEEAPTGRSLRVVLRPLIDAFSGQGQLADPDPNARRAAARKLGAAGDAASVGTLREALGRERDAGVRVAMEEAIALAELGSADDAVQGAAIRTLGALGSLGALERLQEIRADRAAGPAVRQAAETAVRRIERWALLLSVVETAFQGLSLASILLLMALGLAIVFGLMGVINMAHGELMALGAYATSVMQGWFRAYLPGHVDLYFLAALPFAFLIAAAAGVALERGVIRFLYNRPLETLLLTWGVSLIIQQGLRLWFGAANVDVMAPRWLSGGAEVLPGVQLPYNRLFIIALAVAAVLAMYALLFRTDAGLTVRAVTQNRAMASCLGVRARWVDAGTFALGAGLAGLAGCALTQIGNVGPELGQNYVVDSFMVVVTGGVGKLLGSVLAAGGIGGLSKVVEPSLGAVFGKVLILGLVILFIQRRPSGLFAAKGRYADA
jgi:urea transport system permease protein